MKILAICFLLVDSLRSHNNIWICSGQGQLYLWTTLLSEFMFKMLLKYCLDLFDLYVPFVVDSLPVWLFIIQIYGGHYGIVHPVSNKPSQRRADKEYASQKQKPEGAWVVRIFWILRRPDTYGTVPYGKSNLTTEG